MKKGNRTRVNPRRYHKQQTLVEAKESAEEELFYRNMRWLSALLTLGLARGVVGVMCYECVFEDNESCQANTCAHGLFGCVKVITYSGGIGSSGIQSEDPAYQFTTMKGCLFIPFSGINGCAEQVSVGGVRVVTCYCNTDYCNGAARLGPVSVAVLLFVSVSHLLRW